MSTNPGPQLGALLKEGEGQRDAVHVAIAPVIAAHQLQPGQRIGLLDDGLAAEENLAEAIGIVDPFLQFPVEAGEKFYLLLFPNTVTSLRHVWTHPAFGKASLKANRRSL